MKIRISDRLVIDSRSIIRFEWRKYYPALAIHEKYEKHLRWTLRGIAFFGIASSVIAFENWYESLAFALIIFLIELFLERTTVEFSTMVFQPPPHFGIQYNQWVTNGFMIPKERNEEYPAHFGPSYQDEEYANNFFDYLRSWVNDDSIDDTEDNLVVSIVIEPEEEYTTYIYANLKRKRLEGMFDFLGDIEKFEKYGKRQQQMIAQMFYWNTLDFKEGYSIKQFLKFNQEGDTFFFTPSVVQPFGMPPKFLTDKSIKKYHLKVRKREEIQNGDPENIMKPQKRVRHITRGKVIWRRSDEIKLLNDIAKALSQAEDIGFMPNEGQTAGVINMCFTDCLIQYEAYSELIKLAKGEDLNLELIEEGETIGMTFTGPNLIEPIKLSGIPVNRALLNAFLAVAGGGERVVFAIGYPPSEARKLIMSTGDSWLTVKWKYTKI